MLRRSLLTFTLVVASAAAAPVELAAQAPADADAFDRQDRRARALIRQVRCAQHVAGLRQRGVFGPVDSLGGSGQCTVVDGKFVGIFLEPDSQVVRATRFSAVDLATSTRRTAPIDTAAVLAVLRASWNAQERGAPEFEKENRQYTPMPFRFDGDSIEVWLFPVAVITGQPLTVGGERGYVYSPDGHTLARTIDASATWRTFALADTGVARIPSDQARTPLLSELVIANVLHGAGHRVLIEMREASAALVGEGESSVWMHVNAKR